MHFGYLPELRQVVSRGFHSRVSVIILGGSTDPSLKVVTEGCAQTYPKSRIAVRDLQQALCPGTDANLVVSPLIWRESDAFETADVLNQIHFLGQYRVIGPNVPMPGMVEEELRWIAPELDVRVMRSLDATEITGIRLC